MPTPQTIDYSKFKIEVFTPDGELIKEAMINNAHDFYCAGLTPGQEYIIAFSYDDILLLCASFVCNTSGKVIYLNPAHFIFNNGVDMLSAKAGAELAKIVKRREEYKVLFQQWEKQLIENVLATNSKVVNVFSNPHFTVQYKAGYELAKIVK